MKQHLRVFFFLTLTFTTIDQSLRAATLIVTTHLDDVPGSLRTQIMTASAGDTIVFDQVTNSQVFMLTSGEIVIDKSLVIIGNGEVESIINGNGASRCFNISNAGSVEIWNISLTGGSVPDSGGAILSTNTDLHLQNVVISNSTAAGDAATQGGGGLCCVGGMTVIDSCVFSDNTALGISGSGGGLLSLEGSVVMMTNSQLFGNSSNRAGGGIEVNAGADSELHLEGVSMFNNATGTNPGNGGAVHITGLSTVTVIGGTVTNNTAGAEGGGLWNGTGTMNVMGVTIDANIASGAGADQGGGGVFNAGGTINISDNTIITNNIADGIAGSGGGILNDVGGTLTVSNSTISGNASQRAGGGLEDVSGAATSVILTNVTMDENSTANAPGNGGAVHITGPGNMDIIGGTFTNNTAGAEGGGLWNGTGTMNVMGVTIDGNVANGAGADQGGGGVFNAGGTIHISDNTIITSNTANGIAGSGGGILNDVGGSLTVSNSTISGNASQRAGGGLEDVSGAATSVIMTNVTMNENSTANAPGNGGAVHITGPGNMDIIGGTFTNNTAGAEGGGLWNGTGTMNVTGVTIDGNVASGVGADQGGGGVFNAGGLVNIERTTISNNQAMNGGSGGGLHNDASGSATIQYSTISGNQSSNHGGAIASHGTLFLVATTLTNNSSAGDGGGIFQRDSSNTTTISGTILAENTSVGIGADIIGVGTFTSGGYNLIGIDDQNVFPENANDIEGTIASPADSNLDVLADNGGQTQTHAVLCPSEAIDMGDPFDQSLDQVDMSVFGGRRDIGSFEYQLVCVPDATSGVVGDQKGSRVFPNPISTTDDLVIDIPDAFGDDVVVRIIDIATTKQLAEFEGTAGLVTLNSFGSLSAGTYLVQVVTSGSIESHKVIVLHD